MIQIADSVPEIASVADSRCLVHRSAMKSLDMLIFLLVLWGFILDLICLFILPLFVGMCGPFNNFIPYVACTDGAPVTLELRLACYLFGTCGLVRMLSGLFPDQWGLWMAGMGTMALEIGLTIQLVQSEVLVDTLLSSVLRETVHSHCPFLP